MESTAMSKKMPLKREPDCTGIGRPLLWVILALVLGGWLAATFKAKGQGLLGGNALLNASAPPPQVTQPGASQLTGCDGDTGPTVDLSDSIIVTIGGLTNGLGTAASPLSLTWALLGWGIMETTPNRVVLVRAGNYSAPSGGFKCRLAGTAGSPWLIRAYPGESPVILGASGAGAAAKCMHLGDLSSPTPKFLTFRGLRFHNPTVNKSASGHDFNSAGVRIERGNDVTFEHCVVSDNFGTGFDHASLWSGPLTLKYNLVMLNGNGVFSTRAHGAYLHSWASFSNIVEGNIFINNASYGLHAYSSHSVSGNPDIHVNNFKVSRNIMRKSNGTTIVPGGSGIVWRNDTTDGNIHVREDPGTGNEVVENVFSVSANGNLHRLNNHLGLIARSNYFQGGLLEFRHNWTGNFFENNRVVTGAGSGDGPGITISRGTEVGGPSGPTTIDGFTLEANVYNFYNNSTGWQFLSVNKTFAQWKTDTGQDAASTGNTTNPTDTTRFIFQSTVDTNIIHFAILNEGSSATQTIDFSAYWPACGTITIRNAGAYDDIPVVNGVAYTGQTFTLTLSPQTYRQPVADTMGFMSSSPEFFAGIAVRTPANPILTQP